MERFVIIVNGFQPLTIITKRSILDVAAVLDPPLKSVSGNFQKFKGKHLPWRAFLVKLLVGCVFFNKFVGLGKIHTKTLNDRFCTVTHKQYNTKI